MKSIEQRAIEWLLSDDTGSSSEYLCAFLLGIKRRQSVPSDAGDRGRCVRLLKLIPEWQSRLDEMNDIGVTKNVLNYSSGGFTENTDTWKEQIVLIKKELLLK